MRPRILIPSARTNSDAHIPHFHFSESYIQAIDRAGGIPIGVMRASADDIDAIFPLADGLLLMGGYDVDPSRYGEKNIHCISCDKDRDALELLLITKAVAKRIPILAICRGLQMVNVAMGGTLYQDIERDMPGGMNHDFHLNTKGGLLSRNLLAHEISITNASLLHDCTRKISLKVNSLHHQGIKTLGARLRAVAHAPDGLIEAVELDDYPFLLGVQWHPEELTSAANQNVFRAFVEAAKEHAVGAKQPPQIAREGFFVNA